MSYKKLSIYKNSLSGIVIKMICKCIHVNIMRYKTWKQMKKSLIRNNIYTELIRSKIISRNF